MTVKTAKTIDVPFTVTVTPSPHDEDAKGGCVFIGTNLVDGNIATWSPFTGFSVKYRSIWDLIGDKEKMSIVGACLSIASDAINGVPKAPEKDSPSSNEDDAEDAEDAEDVKKVFPNEWQDTAYLKEGVRGDRIMVKHVNNQTHSYFWNPSVQSWCKCSSHSTEEQLMLAVGDMFIYLSGDEED